MEKQFVKFATATARQAGQPRTFITNACALVMAAGVLAMKWRFDEARSA